MCFKLQHLPYPLHKPNYPFTHSLSLPTLTLHFQTTLSFYPTPCHILLSPFPTKPHYLFTLLLVISYSHTSLPNHIILLSYSLSYPTLTLPYQTTLFFYPTPCHILLSHFPSKPHYPFTLLLVISYSHPSLPNHTFFYPTHCPIQVAPLPTKPQFPFTLLLVLSYSHPSLPNYTILLPYSLSYPTLTLLYLTTLSFYPTHCPILVAPIPYRSIIPTHSDSKVANSYANSDENFANFFLKLKAKKLAL